MNFVQKKYTNRDIVRAFGFSLAQVRRWAVVALGIDAIADRGKGTRREYDIDETFKIFLIAVLSSEYHMSLSQATTHLDNLWPHLMEVNLLPSQMPAEMLSGELIGIRDLDIQIYIYAHHYEFRSLIESELQSTDESKGEFIETYRIIRFRPSEAGKHPDQSAPTWINYDEHLIVFFDVIRVFFGESHISRSWVEAFDLRKKKPSRKGGYD